MSNHSIAGFNLPAAGVREAGGLDAGGADGEVRADADGDGAGVERLKLDLNLPNRGFCGVAGRN